MRTPDESRALALLAQDGTCLTEARTIFDWVLLPEPCQLQAEVLFQQQYGRRIDHTIRME